MTRHTVSIESDYLGKYFDPTRLREHLSAAIKTLKGIEFDAIAFRGISGALTAPVLAYKLKKTVLAVRKERNKHSSMMVEGDFGARTYIIVDDFVASGDTIRAIAEEVEGFTKAELVGVYEVNYDVFTKAADCRWFAKSVPLTVNTVIEDLKNESSRWPSHPQFLDYYSKKFMRIFGEGSSV